MKNIYTYIALSMIMLISCSSSKDFAQEYIPESPQITYQQFYDDLSPYGNWVDYQNYGYVWMPYEQGFRPYYNNGHWLYTNYGWTWVSNYNWGWAPFHYGRWLYDDFYGWLWVPGYEWAPAWVSWRGGGDYYGWAPLGPGLNFGINYGSRIPSNYWSFVPCRYINSPRIDNYYINKEKNVTIINNTTVINNTVVTKNKTEYVEGPPAKDVEKITNQKIRPVKIVQKNTPGNTVVSGSTVAIYKPAVKETQQQKEQIKPSRIVKLTDLKERRENAAIQNQIHGNEAPAKPVPTDSRTREVVNSKRINNLPPVNEKPNPVVQKPTQDIDKQVQAQQPPKVIPDKQVPVNRQLHTRGNNEINQQNNINRQPVPVEQNNNINQQPPVINNQPARVPSDENSGNRRDQVSPATINRQPIRTQQMNTVRQQEQEMRQQEVRQQQVRQQEARQQQVRQQEARQQEIRQREAPIYRQENRFPVNRTPIVRDQNPGELQGTQREFQKYKR